MKQHKITVGIPAYNEEKNISVLIGSLLEQEEIDFKIKEIIVVSDSSTDKTPLKVKQFKDKRIKLISNKVRRGQIFCHNLIFSRADTDIVVILEADTCPKDSKYLHKLIKNLVTKPYIGLAYGNFVPISASTLFGKILSFQQSIYLQVIIRSGLAGQKLCSGRGGRAFSKKIYKSLRWPLNVPEDVYSFFWCQQRKIKTAFERKAICYYKTPQTLEDLFRERQKINSARLKLMQYFDKAKVNDFYRLTKGLSLRMFLAFVLEKPVYCLLYSLINFYTQTKLSNRSFTDFWPMTSSTKFLYKTL